MKKLMITILSLFSLMCASSAASAEEAGLWDTTKSAASTAARWSTEKAEQGWSATRNTANHIVTWTEKQSRSMWKASKQGASRAIDWTSTQSKRGWEATKLLLPIHGASAIKVPPLRCVSSRIRIEKRLVA